MVRNTLRGRLGELDSVAYVGTFAAVSCAFFAFIAVILVSSTSGPSAGKGTMLPALQLIYELAFMASGVAVLFAFALVFSKRDFREEVPALLVFVGTLFFVAGIGGMYSDSLATRRLFLIALVSAIMVITAVGTWLLYSEQSLILTHGPDIMGERTEAIATESATRAAHEAVEESVDVAVDRAVDDALAAHGITEWDNDAGGRDPNPKEGRPADPERSERQD